MNEWKNEWKTDGRKEGRFLQGGRGRAKVNEEAMKEREMEGGASGTLKSVDLSLATLSSQCSCRNELASTAQRE